MTDTKIVIAENNSDHFEYIQDVCIALALEHYPTTDRNFNFMRSAYSRALENGTIKEVEDEARLEIKTRIADFIANDSSTAIFIISDQLKEWVRDVTGMMYYITFVKEKYPNAYVLFTSDFELRKNLGQIQKLGVICEQTKNCEFIKTPKEHPAFKEILALALKRIQVLQRTTQSV